MSSYQQHSGVGGGPSSYQPQRNISGPQMTDKKTYYRRSEGQPSAKVDFDTPVEMFCKVRNESDDIELIAPNPLLEYYRFQKMSELRSFFGQLCHELGLSRPPKEAFNRWLFSQLTRFRSELEEGEGEDPILFSPSTAYTTDVLKREIIESTPMRVKFHSSEPNDLEEQLRNFISSIRNFIKNITSKELINEWKMIDFDVSNYLNTTLLMNKSLLSKEELYINLKTKTLELKSFSKKLAIDYFDNFNRLEELAYQANNVIEQIRGFQTENPFKGYFDLLFIDDDFVELDLEMIEKAAEEGVDQEPVISEYRQLQMELDSQKKKFSLPYYFPSKYKTCYEIGFQSDHLLINSFHFDKLLKFFTFVVNRKRQALDKEPITIDKNAPAFRIALYCLLRRYETLYGTPASSQKGSPFSGAGFHAAAPETVFEFLHEHFQVSQEIFASPLNTYFRSYCSAFPDIDNWFGCRSTAMDFEPVSGSYEVGPPYTEEAMLAAQQLVDKWLAESSDEEPLSFVVFVPDWTDPRSPVLEAFDASPFLVRDFVASGEDHMFISGHQHNPKGAGRRRYYQVPHGTHAYILQNAAGRDVYRVDDEFVAQLQSIMQGT
ncbi:hypothetical protein PCE1_003598 [Barthelona sp. PCE]